MKPIPNYFPIFANGTNHDDMEILDRIIGEIKDAFKYCKARNKNKYYGDRFEEWVVRNSNIQKVHPGKGNPFWKLLEWRGDKYIDGYSPLSSSAPDLLLECLSGQSRSLYEPGEIIAIECKWKSRTADFFLRPEDIEKYESYIRESSRYPIKCLFYVFGFGWSGDCPEAVYVIPAHKLYHYDKDADKGQAITFLQKGNREVKAQAFEKYRCAGPCLMYRL